MYEFCLDVKKPVWSKSFCFVLRQLSRPQHIFFYFFTGPKQKSKFEDRWEAEDDPVLRPEGGGGRAPRLLVGGEGHVTGRIPEEG